MSQAWGIAFAKTLWWGGVQRAERAVASVERTRGIWLEWREGRGQRSEYSTGFSLHLESNIKLTTAFKHAGDISWAYFRNWP